MNLLYITPYLPVFGSHGCASKTYDDIALLSLRHQISLVSFVAPCDKEKINCLEKMNCKVYPFFIPSYRYLPYGCREMTCCIGDLIEKNQIDILQCETSFMAKYLPFLNGIPAVLTKHQIPSLYFWRDFKIRKNPFVLLRIIKNILDEKLWFLKFERIIFLSQHDKKIVEFLINDKSKIKIIPLGIDLEYFHPCQTDQYKYDACFLGNFLNYPNVDAFFYFVYKILPLVKKSFPHFSLLIIGNNPPESIRQFSGKENIHITGCVEDVRPFLLMSKIFIHPMRLGSGMRRKLLEAWAMEKPIISTTTGCEGLRTVNDKNILIADNPVDFSKKIKLLMDDENLRGALGKEGRITLKRYHNREEIVASLEKVYLELIS
mgnify:CR=1 FL=1